MFDRFCPTKCAQDSLKVISPNKIPTKVSGTLTCFTKKMEVYVEDDVHFQRGMIFRFQLFFF